MVDRIKCLARLAKFEEHSTCHKTIVHIIQDVLNYMSKGHLS